MIIDSKGMKAIETASGIPTSELMENAGRAVADFLYREIPEDKNILIVCGKGNNGGDGLVACRLLNRENCKAVLIDGEVKTPEAKEALKKLDRSLLWKTGQIRKAIEQADVIVDAVYGFSYHGQLQKDIRRIFELINDSGAYRISIDINSGAESDTGYCDREALISDVTLALDCYKPFHMLNKEHRLFKKLVLLDLDLPHPEVSPWHEMNEDIFFANFPRREINAYKGTYGKTLICGGSYGMAGALSLNIIGARTVGAPYIDVALPERIYPIAASHHITPVFHPFHQDNMDDIVIPLVQKARAIAFGSGTANEYCKGAWMDAVLQNCRGPVVLDAEALRLLRHNTYLLRFIKAPVIITPHVGEFADLLGLPVETIMDAKIRYASDFAKEYKVIVVLKGPNTVVVSPAGDCYINQSGNQGLAQAGSGDLLTGIMAGLLTMTRDVFTAVCMAVWLHGRLAEKGAEKMSVQGLQLERYPEFMNELFLSHHM